MSSNTCINLCSHHYNQDIEQFSLPSKLLCSPVTPYPLIRAPITTDHFFIIIDLCLGESHIIGIIEDITFDTGFLDSS